jgi:ADP-heptose:LPS heptosyltransferase
MIAMDSGNAHMAAMMGVSVITLWGVTHPYAGFKPFNQPFKNCLLADRKKFPKVPTSVYGNKYPKEYEGAISTISEDSILQAVKRSF